MPWNVRGLLAAAPLFLLAVACAPGPSPGEGELTRNLEEVAGTLEEVQQAVSALAETAEDLEGRLQESEEAFGRLTLDLSRVGPGRYEFLPNPPPEQVTVQILAEVLNAGLPGEFKFFLAPEDAVLFTTESLPPGEPVPVGPELVDGIAFIEPGVLYTLQVVYQNPTDREVTFLVRGGIIDPQAALPFMRNRCWCAAIPFSVPAQHTYYRTIQVGVGPDTPAGAKAVVIFPIVPLTE